VVQKNAKVLVMTALRHPNVVLFMGASTKAPNLCIVMEYMSLGSLFDVRPSLFFDVCCAITWLGRPT
jgi:serine/threonine protein kinase